MGQMACPSVGTCLDAGDYFDANNFSWPVIYTLSNGSWQSTAVTLPSGTQSGALQYMSCSSTSFCAAAGYLWDSSGKLQGLLVTDANGIMTVVTAPVPAGATPGSDEWRGIQAVSCPADGWCVARLRYTDTALYQHTALLNLANGTWSVMAPGFPPSSDQGDTISGSDCPAQGWCVFAGDYSTGVSTKQYFVETYANGSWSESPVPLPPDAPSGSSVARTGSVSCPTTGWCAIDSSYDYQYYDSYGQQQGATPVAMLTFDSGTLTATTIAQPAYAPNGVFNVVPVSCSSPGVCVAGAYYSLPYGGEGVILALASGTWTEAAVAQNTGYYDTSCPASDWCVLTGTENGIATVDYLQTGGTPTSVVTSPSMNPGLPGSPVTYNASVSPRPDGGSVGFWDGGEPISGCGEQPIDPATGSAHCSVTYSAAGAHAITARYFGDTNFAESGPSPEVAESVTPPCPTGVTHQALGEPWAVAAMTAVVNGRTCAGYWIVTRAGGVIAVGAAPWYGDEALTRLNAPMIGIAATASGKGYYLLGADGGIFTFGDAQFHGSTGSMRLNAPVVTMAVTATGHGYWLTASDGGIFTFGDAPFYGSMGSKRLNKPVVGMSADPRTGGYWMVAADGGIFSFNAPFYGSMGSKPLNQPVVGMTTQPDGTGYRLVAADGGVFDFGSALFYGSLPGEGVKNPQVTTMAPSVDGNGYYLINSAGTIWAFGDAPYLGNA